jgi:hypothetical protein
MTKTQKTKFDTDICNDNMTFSDCEMAILRNRVQENNRVIGSETVNNKETREIIEIVKQFIIDRKLLCYGGTAINNVLPTKAQFYDYTTELPDFDFYSKDSLNDAVELADIYFKKGFKNIEAKAGIHKGTFKVYVDFIPIADITHMNKVIFDNLFKESVKKDGIHYVPINFLRMGIYLELSRPRGDTTRWEKITQRLSLLNQYFPFGEKDCKQIDFEESHKNIENKTIRDDQYIFVRDKLIQEGCVFFGGYARQIYSQYIPPVKKTLFTIEPSFDVLAENHKNIAKELQKLLESNRVKNVTIDNHEALDDIIPKYSIVSIDGEPIAFIYEPIACHSYNTITFGSTIVKIASIDTILTFYLTFLYANKSHHNTDRLFCMAKYFYELQQKNLLGTTGILKRFSTDCYGEQETLKKILEVKANKYKELKKKPDSMEYKQWFLKYNPETGFMKYNQEIDRTEKPSNEKLFSIEKSADTNASKKPASVKSSHSVKKPESKKIYKKKKSKYTRKSNEKRKKTIKSKLTKVHNESNFLV